MGLEQTRAKAVLTADASQFTREIKGASGGFTSLQRDAGRANRAIASAMAFTRGLGIVTAVRQAQQFWRGLISEMEESGRRLARGIGGGRRAEDLFAQAARLRGEAADPFRFISPLARLGGTAFAAGAGALGGAAGFPGGGEMGRLAAEQGARQLESLRNLINSTDDAADGLDLLGRQAAENAREAGTEAAGLIAAAPEFGLERQGARLREAIVEGVADTVTDLTMKLRQEIAARIAERAIYDDFER